MTRIKMLIGSWLDMMETAKPTWRFGIVAVVDWKPYRASFQRVNLFLEECDCRREDLSISCMLMKVVMPWNEVGLWCTRMVRGCHMLESVISSHQPVVSRVRHTLWFWYIIGVFNALEGCDGEIEIKPGLTETNMGQVRWGCILQHLSPIALPWNTTTEFPREK